MARILNALWLALTELRRNWTRSALTSLGVLIGVAAVIAMVGIGRGATQSIEGDLASMGNNLLMVESGRGGGPQARTAAVPFDLTDAQAIETQVPYLSAVAPVANASTTAVSGGLEWTTTVTGSTSGYLIAADWTIADGRGFTEGEERSGAAVCLIGETLREELFEYQQPLGASVRLGDVSCRVVGLLEAKGENTMGMDQDNVILAPLGLVQRRMLGSTDISTILVSVDEVEHMDMASGSLELLLRKRRHVTSDDTVNFEIRDTREMAARVSGITNLLTAFLAAVAAVSLLVGGIGIMNIMLVSVTERTREIGIRMSIGALEGDVMLQFLVEAVVLSGLGGLAGVLVGIGLTAIGSVALDVPFVIEPVVTSCALIFSALMGVVFGYWPARRAARLEPIDALRHT